MADPVAEDSSAGVTRWFNGVTGVSAETIARLRPKVQSKLDAGAGRNVVPIAPPELVANYELRACVGQVVLEEWDTLSDEERLLVCCHPCARQMGDQVRLPNRAVGTVVAQELTKRLSVFITVRLTDGSLYGWEFFA